MEVLQSLLGIEPVSQKLRRYTVFTTSSFEFQFPRQLIFARSIYVQAQMVSCIMGRRIGDRKGGLFPVTHFFSAFNLLFSLFFIPTIPILLSNFFLCCLATISSCKDYCRQVQTERRKRKIH